MLRACPKPMLSKEMKSTIVFGANILKECPDYLDILVLFDYNVVNIYKSFACVYSWRYHKDYNLEKNMDVVKQRATWDDAMEIYCHHSQWQCKLIHIQPTNAIYVMGNMG
jgi:hypothetical protein